jgi:hypothetical protein
MRAALAVRPDAQGAARVLGSWQRVDAATDRLACLIDPSFLGEAGWDPGARVLSLPHEHPLLGWRVCPAPGCGNPLYGDARECGSCRRADVSEPAARRDQRAEERRGGARLVPVAAGELCQVRACERERGNRRYCRAHYERVLKLRRADPSFNEKAWQAAEEAIRLPVEGPGQVSLHGVAARAVVEMLYGLQQRTRTGAATDLGRLRQIASELRGTGASCLADLDADGRTQHSSPAVSSGMPPGRSWIRRPRPARTCGIWRCSGSPASSPSPRSASAGCGKPPSGGPPMTCRAAAARSPPLQCGTT